MISKTPVHPNPPPADDLRIYIVSEFAPEVPVPKEYVVKARSQAAALAAVTHSRFGVRLARPHELVRLLTAANPPTYLEPKAHE